MIRQVAEQLLDSGIEEVLVVLGHEAGQVSAPLEGLPVRLIFNENYHMGMTSSIQAGVSALSPGCAAFMVCLGDMPLLSGAHYVSLIHFFEEKKTTHPAPIVRPAGSKGQGHPVLFDAAYIPQILACGESEGCREVIRQNRGHLFGFPAEDEAWFLDLDERKDYEQWR
jgi:molybdenum cofactor cytidylyltransferase